MRKKREFIEGAFYHVTSRANNKNRVFERRLEQRIMIHTLEDAKEKFGFCLTNFCIMPSHIHLLIKPNNETCLSKIMQWIKTHSAKRLNFVHGSTGHLWEHRYFARVIKDNHEYNQVMNYIDQNPVAAGLAANPAEWKASGAYQRSNRLADLVSSSA